MDSEELVTYMEYLWVAVEEDGILTLGVNEECLEGFDSIDRANLPEQDAHLNSSEICGELDTDQGPVNLYSPIEGNVLETNEAVMQNPNLIIDDPYGDGWLVRIEAENPDQLENLQELINSSEDEDY